MAQYQLLFTQDVGAASVDYAEKFASLTRGGIFTASADTNRVPRILAVGSTGQVLTVNASGDVEWGSGVADALIYKGTVGSGGTHEIAAFNSLATYSVGWTYRVITAGTIKGVVCEVGDLVTAIVARTGTGQLDADWTVTQTNLDGAVVGPASATDNNIAQFNGVTGKIIEDSTLSNTDVASAISLKHAAVTITAGGGLVLSTQALSMWSAAPAAYNSDCSAVGIMAYDGNYWYVGITAGSAGAGRWARTATAKTW